MGPPALRQGGTLIFHQWAQCRLHQIQVYLGPPVPLLDRDAELATLGAALEAARSRQGAVVVLEGAAGTGKSALVALTCQLASTAGVRVLTARGGELEQDYPFGLIRQLYEPLLAAASAHRRSQLLAGAAAPAGWVLGDPAGGETGMHAAGFAAMQAIYWLTAHLAGEGPLLLTVDDGQWADPSSLRALDFLARRITDLPATLLVALRPQEPESRMELLDELRRVANSRMSLGALRSESVAHLVRDRMPEASNAVCDACHAATAGNPLYLQELLRFLSVDDVVPDADTVLRASVPTLGDRVMRRVERVSGDAPALARAMAVLGNGARLAVAAEQAAVSEEQAGRIAHRLRRIELLSAEDPIGFVHPLIRRSVYDAIPETERQAAHRRAAGLLQAGGAPPESIAAHLRTLTPSGDVAVTTTLLMAAERALERAAVDEAVGWLERALAEGAPDPPRAHLLARLGTARTIQRDPAAIADLREAYELAEDPELRGRVAVALAELLGHAGQWNAAIDVIESLEPGLGGAGSELEAEVAAIRGIITLNDPERIADFDRHRATYEKLAGDDHWASYALAALLAVEAANRGRPDEAIAFGERALEGGRLLGERGAGGWTAPQLLGAFVEAEDLERAADATDQVEAAARASGSAFGLLTALGSRGWAHARRGDLAAAESDLTTVLAFARDAGLLMGVTSLSFFMIDVLLERETLSDVAELVEQTQLGADFLNTTSGAMLLEVRGRLRLLRRDNAEAVDDLRAAGRTISALRFGPSFSTWRSSLALALPAADREEARALADEELELARPTGLARPQAIALRTLGVLEATPAGIDLLRQSVALLEDCPARLEHARSLVELGGALRRANQRSDARSPLVAGLRLAHQCGAQRLSRRAQQELQAAGGRRPRLSTTGRDALTASELRVVNLAVSGATNTEIAQELYVSLKTVETHLSRAYLKLGLAGSGSRGRLLRVLEEAS
jgi:DNA-binding CsgD family transcriptional regulator